MPGCPTACGGEEWHPCEGVWGTDSPNRTDGFLRRAGGGGAGHVCGVPTCPKSPAACGGDLYFVSVIKIVDIVRQVFHARQPGRGVVCRADVAEGIGRGGALA